MSLKIASRSLRHVAVPKRAFTVSVKNMAEGDTGSGSSRAGGVAQGDSFSKREKANEDLYVKQQESQKLRTLMAKLKDQQKNIEDLHKDLEAMAKEGESGSK